MIILGHHFVTILSAKMSIWASFSKSMCTFWSMVHMKYDSWDTKWERISCHFESFFAFLPPNNLENQYFGKMKKAFGDVIILQMPTKITIIWCMLSEIWSVTDIILSFCSIFCPFNPLTKKIKILKNLKKCQEISSFYTRVP